MQYLMSLTVAAAASGSQQIEPTAGAIRRVVLVFTGGTCSARILAGGGVILPASGSGAGMIPDPGVPLELDLDHKLISPHELLLEVDNAHAADAGRVDVYITIAQYPGEMLTEIAADVRDILQRVDDAMRTIINVIRSLTG